MLRFLLRRQAQDARHHGQYEPEGKLCCEETALNFTPIRVPLDLGS